MTDADTGTVDAVITSVRIEAPPEVVFTYLVDPEKLVRWMGVSADLQPRPGGQFRVDVNGRDEASGEYVEVDPPHRVVFTWGWEGSDDVPPGSTTVSIALVADGDATVLELTHRGLPGGAHDVHLEGWTHYLARLQVAGTGEDPGADPNVA